MPHVQRFAAAHIIIIASVRGVVHYICSMAVKAGGLTGFPLRFDRLLYSQLITDLQVVIATPQPGFCFLNNIQQFITALCSRLLESYSLRERW